jgi:membrane protein required for colicin V production
MTFSLWDLLLLVPLIIGVARGFRKGLIMELISIAALILGIIGGFQLMHQGVAYLDDHIALDSKILPFLSFLLIFIVIVVGVHFVGRALRFTMRLTPLGMLDSLGGAALGLLKWAFGLSVLLWLLEMADVNIPAESTIYYQLKAFAPMVIEKSKAIFPFTQDLIDAIKEIFENRPKSIV